MTIQELGSIGEFIAAVVVVITLVFLTVQMKQYSDEFREWLESKPLTSPPSFYSTSAESDRAS